MTKTVYPGKDVVDRAYREGNVRKCPKCGAEILGWAFACVRDECPFRHFYHSGMLPPKELYGIQR